MGVAREHRVALPASRPGGAAAHLRRYAEGLRLIEALCTVVEASVATAGASEWCALTIALTVPATIASMYALT